MDFRSAFAKINDRFGWVSGYMAEGLEKLPTSLQEEVAQIVTDLVVDFMRPTLLHYIETPVTLKDGTTIEGQSSFDRMVEEDKDLLALIEKYRPSYLWYLDRATKIRQYIRWDNERFVDLLAPFLEENGVRVDGNGRGYLLRTSEGVRRRIYSSSAKAEASTGP